MPGEALRRAQRDHQPLSMTALAIDEDARRIANGAKWKLVRAVLTFSGTTLLAVVLAQVLGPIVYANAKCLQILRKFYSNIQNHGLGNASVFQTARGVDPRATFNALAPLQMGIAATLSAGTLAFVLTPISDPWLSSPAAKGAATALAVLPFVMAWEPTFIGPLTGQLLVKEKAQCYLVGVAAQCAVVLGFLAFDWRLGAVIAGFLASSVGIVLSAAFFSRRFLRPATTAPPPGRSVRRFAMLQTHGAVSLFLCEPLNFFWVKAAPQTASRAGAYVAALALACVIAQAIEIAYSTLFPMVVDKIERGRRGDAARLVRTHALRMAAVFLPVLALYSAAAPRLLTFAFGPEYAISGPTLAILFFSTAIFALYETVIDLLGALDRPASSTLGWLVLGVQAALLPVLVPGFGLAGAAAAYGLGALAGLAPAAVRLREGFADVGAPRSLPRQRR